MAVLRAESASNTVGAPPLGGKAAQAQHTKSAFLTPYYYYTILYYTLSTLFLYF